MYKPSVSFMKKLKVLDPKLDCYFNSNAERFVITYQRATGEPVPIIQVRTEDDNFRFPDQRDIDKLCEGDCLRVSMKDRLNRASKYMQEYREKARANAKENLRLMTIDDSKILRKGLGRLISPKSNSSIFRRILPKAKGKVF